jgi:hypothetical protein
LFVVSNLKLIVLSTQAFIFSLLVGSAWRLLFLVVAIPDMDISLVYNTVNRFAYLSLHDGGRGLGVYEGFYENRVKERRS